MTLEALVLNPDLESRVRMKEISKSLAIFKQIQVASTLQEGLERLKSFKNCDVIYVSSRYEKTVLSEFIKAGKESKNGADSAYLLIFTSAVQDIAEVAGYSIQGVDGFLFEPYSAENLVQSTVIAQRVRREKLDTREKAAVELLLRSASESIDTISQNLRMMVPVTIASTSLKSVGSKIASISEDFIDYYFEKAIETFTTSLAPVIEEAKYAGVSSRVKNRVIRKRG